MRTRLVLIAALGKNREIGLNGKLPWSIPDEYQHYLDTVKGKYVLIGRKNYELNGSDISGAYPLILSHNPNYQAPRALVFQDIFEVFQYTEDSEIDTLYVIGGAEIYQLTLPYASEFLWSEINYDGPADTYFPEFLHFEWTKIAEETHRDWKVRHLIKIPQKLY